MAKKKKTSVTPTTAAGASGCPPPATEPSTQGAMQHLKTLNSLLLNQTMDLREQIRQLRSEHAAVSADRCIGEGIERDVCGVVVSSHLASTAEGCAALLRKADDDLAAEKAAAAETTASLLKKADASAAELFLAKKMLLAASREKNVLERDLERAVEERDLSRSYLDEERMKLKYLNERLRSMEQVSAQNTTSLQIAAATECRRLEEVVLKREKSLQYAMQEMNSLKKSLQEKMDLIVELERENEKVKEEGKMREEILLQSAMRDEGLLEEQITELVILYEEMKSRKEGEIKILNAEIESNASKILSLEEKCCCLNKIRNQSTVEISDLKCSLDELKKKSKWRNSKWLYPAATTIFAAVVSIAFAARARAR